MENKDSTWSYLLYGRVKPKSRSSVALENLPYLIITWKSKKWSFVGYQILVGVKLKAKATCQETAYKYIVNEHLTYRSDSIEH